jgi:hypothetical protein
MHTREKLTYSLNGAAYAVAKGVRLLRTFKEPSGKHTLVLDDGYDQASEALREFFDGEPMVNARTYAECRRFIIDEMHTTSTPQGVITHGSSTAG